MPHPVDIHVGRQLRARRELRGLSQVEISKRLGLSFQQIQKNETGTNRIGSSRLWQLSEILGVTPGYFFEGLESKRATTAEPVDGRSARQVLDLNNAFKQIDDTKVRRNLVHLVKSLKPKPAAKPMAMAAE